MAQPANIATPLVTVIGLVVHDSVPVGSPPVHASVTTAALSVVTTLPPASSSDTTGCWRKAAPASAALPGCAVKTSCVAAPGWITTPLLIAMVRTGLLVGVNL